MTEFPYPDVAPAFLGNWALKEIVLYSILVFDRNRVRRSLCPVVVVAPSGSGKSEFLMAMEEGLGKDVVMIWGVDSMTGPSIRGMVDKNGKVKKGKLTIVSDFDEINKWSVHNLEGVLLPVFGGEHGHRMREGMSFDTTAIKTIPIGTLLPGWREFEGSGASAQRRLHTLEQLLRRCIVVYLETSVDNEEAGLDYMQYVTSKVFDNVEYDRVLDLEGNRRKFRDLLNFANQVEEVWFDPEELEEMMKYLNGVRKRMMISRNVRYTEEFPFLVLKLARGRALANRRKFADFDDVKHITAILTGHAKILGMWDEGEIYDGKQKKFVSKEEKEEVYGKPDA